MKHKLIAWITAGVLLVAGLLVLLFGNRTITSAGLPTLDAFSLSEENLGKQYIVSPEEPFPCGAWGNNQLYLDFLQRGEDERALVIYAIPPMDAVRVDEAIEQETMETLTFQATLKPLEAGMQAQVETAVRDYYAMLAQYEIEIPSEAEQAEMFADIVPYHLQFAAQPNRQICLVVGILLITAAVLTALITFLKGKRWFRILGIGLLSLLLVILLVAFLLLKDRLRSMASVKQVGEGLYTMRYYVDYDADALLAADISSNSQLIEWICGEVLYGYVPPIDYSNFGCSAFAAVTPDGKPLMGRNFDYPETDTLLVYTTPKGGYASYGVADLQFFGLSQEETEPDSLTGRALMLAAPYVVMDGVNEAGVAVGILELDMEEVHQDQGKGDLLIYAAIRGILDNCASVDEAVSLLASYDIHTALDCSYHLFLADNTGRSVVVEWLDGEMSVIEADACTNHVLTEGAYYLAGSRERPEEERPASDTIRRWNTLRQTLDDADGVLDGEAAMTLLSDVSWQKPTMGTEWSCVYHLADFAVDIALEGAYETVYHFEKGTLD